MRSTRPTVLFVDDEQANLNLFKNLLKRDFRVETCKEGEAALALLSQQTVAVLVCDQRMPGLSGTEILSRAREISPATVRVLVTAYPDIDVAIEAINQGRVRRYLEKPWEPSELRAIIEQCAEIFELNRRNRELVEALRQRNQTLEEQSAELARKNTELQRLDRVKTDLLTNVSHELRTPLVSIRGYADLMRSGRMGDVTEPQLRALRVIQRSVKRLVGLIEDLLDLARLERGEGQLVRDPLDLGPVLAELTEALRARADEAGIALHLELEDSPLVVDGERRRLEQVFTNLLDNALKFNPPGGEVSVRAGPTVEGGVRVVVRDTGVGIPEAHLEHIFTRFYQVDASSTRQYGGTGIGLSLVQRITRDHGGTVEVASVEGEGSTFTVTLPPSAQDAPAVAARLVADGTHRLLELITDEASVLELSALHLTSAGLVVRRATTLEQALAEIDSAPLDVLLIEAPLEPGERSVAWQGLRGRHTGRRPLAVITRRPTSEPLDPDRTPAPGERHFGGPVDLERVVAELTRSLARSSGEGPSPQPFTPPPTTERRVLIVDDDRELLDYTAELLACEDIGSYTTIGADEALRLVRSKEDIGLILLDVAMPITDGFTLCRELRSTPGGRNVPIYMVSARADPDTVRRSLSAGADGYLIKPFAMEEFLSLVRRVLRL